MKQLAFVIFGLFALQVNSSFGDEGIDLRVTSHTNVGRDGSAMEVCGTAVHPTGVKPLLVTVTHARAASTTISNGDGKWCVVIKRWTFNGVIEVSAATFDHTAASRVIPSSLNE